LLQALGSRMERKELDDVIRTVGLHLAVRYASESLATRVKAAAAALGERGGITEVKTRGNGGVTFLIHGLSCPLDAVVRSHPAVCGAIESFVAEINRAPAHEDCHRAGDQPHCVIDVDADPSKRMRSPGRATASR
jgi:predicted ArsR family transcriptional regulator